MLQNPHSTIRPCELSLKLRSHHYIRWAENFPVRGPNVYTKSPSWPRPFQLLSARSSSLSGQVSPPTPQTRGSPFTADNGHKNQISILHLHNWAAYEKARKSRLSIAAARLDDKHCGNHNTPAHNTLPVMLHWFTLRSLTEPIIPVALLLGSARLGSAAVAHGGLTAAAAKESLSPGHKQEVNPPHRPCLHWLWSAY